MNSFINQSQYQSTLERIDEISRFVNNVENFNRSVQEYKGKVFSDVVRDLSAIKLKFQFQKTVNEAARENNLDPRLVNAVIEQESGFNPNAVSEAGALGLMQLMPNTARHLGVKDPLNPHENVRAGTKYLSSLLNRYQGNVVLALSAYNAGPANVDKYQGVPPFEETKNYVRKIINKLT